MFKPEKDDNLGIFRHGVSVGKDQERIRILNLIMEEGWSGESLEEDRKNLVYRITQPLIEEI
jgi:hypothetical protein